MTTFITRVNFNNTNKGTNKGTNGGHRVGGLFGDASGDFSGTTALDGAHNFGSVTDIPSSDGSDAGTPASFNGTNGASPDAGLTAGAAGDPSGTTIGTVTNTDTGTAAAAATDNTTTVAAAAAAAPTLTILAFLGGSPGAGLIADAAGDLFGTTANGGTLGAGTAFEIAKTAGGYASTPTTLVSFHGTNGAAPGGSLIADAAGDLFGTTAGGGAYGVGTVFELANTGGGYATAPTVLASFTNGPGPFAGLIADAAGNLFGTTYGGGASGSYGTVFEIAKTSTGYARTPTTLVNFNGTDGQHPESSLIADAAGDLFGTTQGVGLTAMARCSRSPRAAAATPARRPRCGTAPAAPTGHTRRVV